ncbi:membrane protein, putative [Babesia bigemina]|uniref:Membrane protein, putative n=1 Tax=Babesia bigemina TaxID=5866 RepID=A0A061DER8_BABBI|nr:membrane protein, putative [Babesia bigemina]CDR97755.1 membrane protein, putative [Babesia bigemina]|eukprot:XP_012769941.1 membrane protein, putative [Babesia bigemina]
MGMFGGKGCGLLVVSLVVSIFAFATLSVILFTLNLDGKNTFKPYISDRFVLPFPSLFEEFELDSNVSQKSSVQGSRGSPETCWRRVAPEYETYVSGRGKVFDYVAPKRFTVGGDMPAGWLSYTPIDSSVIVVVDGARVDYALYDPTLKPGEPRAVFTNHMPLYHDYLHSPTTRNYSRFFRFEAPTPTFTTFSFKCLFTGESRRGNMWQVVGAATAVQLEIDNFGNQLAHNGDKLCLLGDVISYDLLGPERVFMKHTGKGIDIYDMVFPDSLVSSHYAEFLDQCDVNVLHLLAIDHLGHSGKRVSADMTYYLDDYDAFIRQIITRAFEKSNVMVYVLGDHGQKTNGSHGGATKEEVDSFLFVTSDLELRRVTSDMCDLNDAPTGYAREHNVLNGRVSLSYPVNKSAHINVASSLCLLMNRPVPFHSEGSIIKEIVPLIKDARGNVNKLLSVKYLTQLLHVVAHNALRAVDTTIPDSEKQKHKCKYAAVVRERKVLSHYYSFVRSMGRDQVEPAAMVDICNSYIRQCERLIAATKQMIVATNVFLTPEYMVLSTLFMAIACLLSAYLLLVACRICHVRKLSEDELVFFEARKFPTIGRIMMRGLIKLVLAGAAAWAISAQIDQVSAQVPTGIAVPRHLATSVLKRFIMPFERWCDIEAPSPWFYLACYLCLLFVLCFLLDVPFFVRNFALLYRERKHFAQPLPEGRYDGGLRQLLSHMSGVNPVAVAVILYVLLAVKTIVSQCAIISHDTALRHAVVLSLYMAMFPAVKRTGSLRLYGAYRNFGVLCFVLKFSYLIHRFEECRSIGNMEPQWYIKVNDVFRTFECGAAVLTVYYFTLLRLTRHPVNGGDAAEMSLPLKAIRRSPMNRPLLRGVWTIQYVLLMLHYAMKCERHYFSRRVVSWLSMHLIKVRNPVVAKTLLALYSARAMAVLTMLVWLTLALDFRGTIYNLEGVPHSRSNRLFWFLTNMLWMVLLLNGPKKAVGAFAFALVLYNTSSLFAKLSVRSRLMCTVVFLLFCDLMYFVAGHQDSLFQLDFDSAFLFFDTYVGLPCDIAVALAFAIFNITAICALQYLFVSESERDYLAKLSETATSGSAKTGADKPSPKASATAKSTESKEFSHSDLASWIACDSFESVAGYTFLALARLTLTLGILFALSGNQCVGAL